MRPNAFDEFRARHRYLLFFALSAALFILLRVTLHGTSLPEALFEGVVGAGGGTLAMRWWVRRAAARGTLWK